MRYFTSGLRCRNLTVTPRKDGIWPLDTMSIDTMSATRAVVRQTESEGVWPALLSSLDAPNLSGTTSPRAMPSPVWLLIRLRDAHPLGHGAGTPMDFATGV